MKTLLLLAAAAAMTPLAGDMPANYKELAVSAIKASSFDPDSALVRDVPEPRLAQIRRMTNIRDGVAWVTCVESNLKNRMGGYTGYATSAVVIRQGTVIDVIDRSYSETVFESLCGNVR